MKNESAFTLIEILIALAIVSIALTAIVKINASNINTTYRLARQTEASIVANNIISKIQIGLLRMSPAPYQLEGDEMILKHRYHWQANAVASPIPGIDAIKIAIALENSEQTIYHVTAYQKAPA